LPHPGLMVDIVEKGKRTKLVENGLVLYPKPKNKNKLFDIISRHIRINSDVIELEFYTAISPTLKRVFELDAGPNVKYLGELINNASTYEVGVPFISYDETLGEIVKAGDFSVGGVIGASTRRRINLKMKCTGKEDLFVNLVLPLAKERKNSLGVLFQRVCTSGWTKHLPSPNPFSLIGWIFSFIGGLIGFIFSFRFLLFLGFAYALYYYIQREKIVSFWIFLMVFRVFNCKEIVKRNRA